MPGGPSITPGTSEPAPIRVCMVTGFRPTPGGGGMEKHVYELARGLLRRGVSLRIICEDRSFLPDPIHELQDCIISVPPDSLHQEEWIERYQEKSRRFAELLDPEQYDVVHCHSHYGRDVALKLAELPRRPALLTTFHLTPDGSLERFRQLGIPEPEGAPIDRAVGRMEADAACRSDRCIAVSRGVAAEISRFYDVPEDRVVLIYNWYDPRNFQPHAREDARQALGMERDAPYLLYIGHFGMHRGQLLAEAMRHLPSDVTLLVVNPETDARIEREFGSRVRFVGYLPPEQLALHYAASDLQCFPTVYSGFGLALVEGMACGCPPVVFRYSAMNEIVTEQSGYLANAPTANAYADAIMQGLSDVGRKRDAAIVRAGEFQMDRQINRVMDLYRELLAVDHG